MLATLRQTAELVDFFRKKGLRACYEKNDYIIKPGEFPPGVFYIVEGLVKAYNVSRYNEENLLIIRKEHELFPLIWAITGRERKVIYQAISPVTTLRVSREDFTAFMRSNPDTLAPLMDMTLEMYRLHSERLINLEYRTVRERIISFLLTMATRFGRQTEDGVLITAPLRHQDIASSVNSSRETTSRELAIMVRKGLLGRSSSRIVLRDIKALRAYISK
ncbi:MAG TPA: Crp/Fnr family transcriptional regulator [Candidatus Saccharimonadales bacterium]|nr:Crp/Fnr family transcriptional regulator [Candidatus Saccharimonadales bacterium]